LEKCSKSLAIKKLPILMTKRCHLISVGMAIIKGRGREGGEGRK
jgi:hypothetical protein